MTNKTSTPIKDDPFDTSVLKADLKGRSVRGGAVTMAAQGVMFLLQMGSTVVLARLLTPEDYGLVAMVAVVINFVNMFKDMGLSMATVQKSQINHDQISTLFWINLGISLVIMTVVIAIAPVVAWFYGKPELTLVTLALAGTFIFGGLTIQHQALLKRQMHFRKLAAIEITVTITSVFAGIISAWFGAGYWALVIMQLTRAISYAIGVWIGCNWRPGFPKRKTGVRSMLAFGGNLTGFTFVNYFARNMDKILIGKLIGSAPLGFYSKAYHLLMLPLQQINAPISSVVIPALSRLQNDPERYRNYYKRTINLIAFITMPMIFVMAALSDEIIRIVLGAQWANAAIIFKVLAFSAVVQPIFNTVGYIYISLGQTDRMLRWGLISSPIIVLSFIIGIPWGVIGVTISYVICTSLILSVPCLWYAFRYSPVNISDCINSVIRPLLLSTVMYLTIESACYHLKYESAILTLMYGCLAGLVVFGVAMLLWPRVRTDVFGMVKLVKMLKTSESVE